MSRLGATSAALAPLAVAAVLLGSCQRPAPAAPAARHSELDAAFAAAWGSPAPVVRVVERDGERTTLRYAPQSLITLGDRLALISGAQTDGCRSCRGSLAIHYLERTPEGLRVVGAWPELADGAAFGSPPAWKLRTDLFPAQALELSASGGWHGCTVAWADYVELTRDGPVMRARHVLTAYDDAGADGSTQLSAEAVPGLRGESFTVRYSGAGPVDVLYRRRGEAYLPLGPKPDLPTC